MLRSTRDSCGSGAVIEAVGVLVPTGTGSWQLKPRAVADGSATFPTVTIAEARALVAGKTVYIEGVALNARVTFGDQTVHVSDASGVIRTLGVPQAPILSGDSIRIRFATGNYPVGAEVRVRGLLIPATDGTSWELKPRSSSEIVVTGP